MGAGRRAEHDIESVHRGIKPCPENRHGCLNLCQRAFGLANLILRRQPFSMEELYLFQQRLLRTDLFVHDGQSGL